RLASSEAQKVEIGDLGGFLPFSLEVGRITVADRDGEWLAVSDLAVDWSPAALLLGRIDVSHVEIGAIDVARRPLPGKDEGGGAAPAFDISLGRLDLHALRLAEPVAGVAASFSGLAGLRYAGGGADLAATVHVERTDGPGGRFDLKLDADPAADRLVVEGHLSEPAGGVVAGLLRIPDAPALALDFGGTGTLDDFDGTLGLLAGDRKALAGSFRLRPDGAGGRRLGADLAGNLDGIAPVSVAELLAGDIAFALDAGLPADGGLDLGALRLSARNLALDARGRLIAGEPESLAASLVVAAPDDRPIRLVLGDRPAAIGGLRLDLSAGPGEGGTDWRLKIDGDGLAMPDARVGGLAVSASGRAAPGLAVLDETTLTLDLVAADAFAAGRSLGSEIRAALVGTAARDGAATRVALAGPLSGLATGTAALDRLFGDKLDLVLDLTDEGGLAIHELTASNAAVRLTLSGDWGATVDLAAKGRIDNLARLEPTATGAVDLAATVTGTPEAPVVTAEITADTARFGDRKLEGAALKLSGQMPGPTGDLSLSGKLDGRDIGGTARIVPDGAGSVADIDIGILAARAKGRLAIAADGIVTGPLDISAPDLVEIAPLVLADLSGSLAARAEFGRGADGGQVIALAGRARNVETAKAGIGSAELSARITSAFAAPAVEGTLAARAVRAGTQRIETLDLAARPADAGSAITLAARSKDGRADAAAILATAEGGTEIRLSSLDANWKGLPLRLVRPAHVLVAEGAEFLDPAAFDVSGGTLTVSGKAGDILALDVAARDLPARLLDIADPALGAGGRITADARVTGAADAPVVAWRLDWREAALAETRGLGLLPLDIAGKGELRGPRTSLDIHVGGGGLDVTATGTAPVGSVEPVDVKVTGAVPLALANGSLGARGARAGGTLALDLSVKGRLPAPAIGGRVTTSGASFSDPGSGLSASDIVAALRLAGDRVEIEKLTGSLGKNGNFTASGRVGIVPGSDYPADITLAVRDGLYADGTLVTARFSADLALSGPLLGQATARGKVDLQQVDVTVPDKLPASVAVLDVEHRNAPKAVEAQALRLRASSGGGGGSSDVLLDILVNAPGRIFVRGRGLDTELGGTIRLTGPASAPVAQGAFEMRRGRLSLLGKRLEFSRGALDFSGDLDPYLDFVATTDTSDAVITVTVSGRASDPTFAFSSAPALPEEEVLAMLIFGKTTDKLSPAQIASLAASAAELGGLSGGPGLLGRLRQGLGVDDLEVTGDEEGGANVKAGRYVTDKVYLGVSKGTSADSGKVTVDIDVTK
ncbi:MAG TPA: translocation/assembly module TamB domain-containing protein, partial [Hyphomicrobiales bacterium]|nr:translocation/assembly module TamB domain-containing protein [Hyphomicrobiales bacterium]